MSLNEELGKLINTSSGPESGDVYCCESGKHLGSIDISELLIGPKHILHIQVFHSGEWFVYHLNAIQPLEKENAQGTDQASGD